MTTWIEFVLFVFDTLTTLKRWDSLKGNSRLSDEQAQNLALYRGEDVNFHSGVNETIILQQN
jgi:hypothetical protein